MKKTSQSIRLFVPLLFSQAQTQPTRSVGIFGNKWPSTNLTAKISFNTKQGDFLKKYVSFVTSYWYVTPLNSTATFSLRATREQDIVWMRGLCLLFKKRPELFFLAYISLRSSFSSHLYQPPGRKLKRLPRKERQRALDVENLIFILFLCYSKVSKEVN